jgi:hypothetical protein
LNPLEAFEEELVEKAAERVLESLKPRIVTKAALARHFGVGERRVKTWREKGLPAYDGGSMFSIEETERWLEGQP